MNLIDCKKAAGEKAASLIKPNTIVGLGTGSTTNFFIQKLIELCQNGLQIQAVPTSKQSFNLAKVGNVPLLDTKTITYVDIYVDGADEINPQKQMIKGAGGAFLQEKIISKMSKDVIIIIDESKTVTQLGRALLPVEILSFGHQAITGALKNLGYEGSIRRDIDQSYFITENHHLIYDIKLKPHQNNLPFHHQQIMTIPGVIDTGFFENVTTKVITAFLDGRITIT